MSTPTEARRVARATPAMRQYLEVKRQHRDALVFFRMGDFYELFYEDALTAAGALELTLTSRSKDDGGSPIPMCGVPHHAADTYVARLVKRGFRVAICEQVEDASAARKTKAPLRREVVRVVSPGTLTDAGYLDAREPAFLLALAPDGGGRNQADDAVWGAALVDLSTGEFNAAEYAGSGGRQAIVDEVSVLRPREVIVAGDLPLLDRFPELATFDLSVTTLDAWMFGLEHARETLCDQLRTASLDGSELAGHPAATAAAGALVQYLRDTQKVDLAHVRRIDFRSRADHVLIDATTLRHLEIIAAADGGSDGSLLAEIDRTATPMGGRLLRGRLQRPARAMEVIRDRLDAVEELVSRGTERSRLRETLKAVHDLERLVARVALRTAGPRDLIALRSSVALIPRLRDQVAECTAQLVGSLAAQLDDVADVREAIETTLVDQPPPLARDGGCIRDGVDAALDELRAISRDAKQQIAAMERAERERTGIANLKVRFNRVFGYYIEVSNANLHAVPEDYQRRQTVATGERFITPALKEYEEKALGADERLLELELELFEALRQRVAAEATRVLESARAIAGIDVLAALAETAHALNYAKPQVHAGPELRITEGRHPVVERRSPTPFVPNDLLLDDTTQQLVIVTGPNMGGKSTFLRQAALIVLLAHVGSFVPAAAAQVPLTDRVFARVGAADNIARGQSTFMLEMQETARILHTATSESLVLLDEIGRGTATFDGLSLAWAVAEHLATGPRGRPKTLFATHYHELTALADAVPCVANYHVVAREWKDDIIFLRRVEPGRSDRSYGIQVARLAGLPPETVQRARDILATLENDELSGGRRPAPGGPNGGTDHQLELFQREPAAHARILEQLRATKLDELTPLQALTLLADLQRELDTPD